MTPPSPDDIYHQRWVVAGLSTQAAAQLCASSPRTWRAWEKGARRMHPAIWAWFQTVSGNRIPLTREWEGWCFRDGKLYSPENVAYTAPEIRAIPWMRESIRVKTGMLRQHRTQETQQLDKVLTERHRVRGQLNVVGLMLSILYNEFLEEEDPAMRQLAQGVEGLIRGLSACQIEVFKATKMLAGGA